MNQKNIESKVLQLLQEDEQARSNDWYLIGKYLEKFSTRYKGVEGIYLMKHSKDYRLPSAESITRARRKIQSKHKELRGNAEYRALEEEEYREYYREVNI